MIFLLTKIDTHGRVYSTHKKLGKKGENKNGKSKNQNQAYVLRHGNAWPSSSKNRWYDEKSGAKISGPIPLPTEKEIVTILRSPHKYKDSREQFEIRTHKRLIDIYSPNVKLLDSIHLPAGVDIKIKL